MQRIFLFYSCFLVSITFAFGQESVVRITSLLLSQEKTGWRVDLAGGSEGTSVFQKNDLLTQLDGKDAAGLGPLAVMASLNSAFIKTVPIVALRSGQPIKIDLWRGDGTAPEIKTEATKSFVSPSAEAPDFTLASLNDVPVSLASQRGKWVLISFWATWCAPCQQEAQILNRLAKAHPDQLTVLALAVKDSREAMRTFAAKVNSAYAILDAGPLSGEPALAYGVGTPTGGGHIPVSVLVRPDGKIAYVQGGYEDPSPLEKQVQDIMNSK
ncbi:MAG TPA: TlpA disulfide reductase family protein [Candidatus Eremiobacteraceae bacterium]|nr:TlpA disulfide reductase family protein [Candidatus Eremiobacteraceae bacterium]